MGAKNPFKLSADAFERSARPLVAHVGVKADSEHLPRFEGVFQHKQLGFSIGCGPDRGPCQPGVANLTGVGEIAAMPRVARRPRPSLQIEEPRRADDNTVITP